jgi:hypothetical protein
MNTLDNPTATRRKIRRAFVPKNAPAKSVGFINDMMEVTLTDGRIISGPVIWFPLLHEATLEQREKFEIGMGGVSLHWEEIDEDLSVASLFAGGNMQSA